MDGADNAQPTLGEAHRRLDRVETRLDSRVVSLNTYRAERDADREAIRLTRLDLDRELSDLRRDLNALTDRITWAWRAAITSLALPAIIGIGLLMFQRSGP
jgi:hypothetical protein